LAVTRQEAPDQYYLFPQFLPDGRHFLYYTNLNPPGVYVAQLDGSETRRLVDADTGAVYVSSGHLLFLRQGTLFAQAFDPVRLVVTGSAFRVADEVGSGAFSPALSVSAAGTIVYRTGSKDSLLTRPLVWFDRSGREIGKVGDSNPGGDPSLSPDGRVVALVRSYPGLPDIWLLTLDRNVMTRFTSNDRVNLFPVWSPDGRHIVFSSVAKGQTGLYRKPADGAGNEELLLAAVEEKAASDWSREGRFLLYQSYFEKTGTDIWALPMDGDRKPFPVVQTNFEERGGQFSPDGRWIAYQSNETGRFEIYLQPFPGPGGKRLISTNGGAQVRWRRDGRELFYIALDGRLMAVPIRFAPSGETVDAGTPVSLFATRVGGAVQDRPQYVVSSDGQRFLMSTVDVSTSPITVILNWHSNP
jgi:Tol biopolymer transport system component